MQHVKKKVVGLPSVAKQKAQLQIDATRRNAKKKQEREEAKKTIQERKEREAANYQRYFHMLAKYDIKLKNI